MKKQSCSAAIIIYSQIFAEFINGFCVCVCTKSNAKGHQH